MNFYRVSRCINNNKKFISILNRNFSNKIKTINNEWFIKENNFYKIGLTNNVNDIVFLEIEELDSFKKDESIVFLETVKATGEINAPFDCNLIDINEIIINDINKLEDGQENEDNWIIKIEPTNNIDNPDEIINKLKI